MIINFLELRVVQVAAGNPIGFEPGWYAIHMESARSWGPFPTPKEINAWILAHRAKEVAQ